MAKKRVSAEEAKKLKGKTNWDEFDALTEKEIERAAQSDSDSALPSKEELKKFTRVKKGH